MTRIKRGPSKIDAAHLYRWVQHDTSSVTHQGNRISNLNIATTLNGRNLARIWRSNDLNGLDTFYFRVVLPGWSPDAGTDVSFESIIENVNRRLNRNGYSIINPKRMAML